MPAQGSTPGSVGVDESFEDNLRFVLSWTPNTIFSSSDETKTKSQKVKVYTIVICPLPVNIAINLLRLCFT